MIKKVKIAGVLVFVALGIYVWLLYPFSLMEARPAIGEKKIAVSGNRAVIYYVRGEGPRILLAASLGREASDYNELTAELNSAGYRTISIEAPGIGGTDMLEKPTSLYEIAEDIKAVADQDISDTGKKETVALVGHAFGNRVMRAAASKYPDIARSVILLAAGGQRPVPPKAKKELKKAIMPYLTASRRTKAIDYAFFAQGNEVPDYWLRGWHIKTALLQASTLEQTKDNLWQDAGSLPLLIVQALEDEIAPKQDTADLLKKRFGDRLEVALVENAGHALLPEHPKVISKAVLDFLNRHKVK